MADPRLSVPMLVEGLVGTYPIACHEHKDFIRYRRW
jgi:hypothetical protein